MGINNKIIKVEHVLCEGSFGSGKYYGYNNKKIISLVKISTKKKIYGIGESLVGIYSPELFEINTKYLSKFLVGKNSKEGLQEITGLQKNKFFINSGLIKSILSAIEMSLIDIISKEEQLSISNTIKKLYKLKTVQHDVNIYSSAGSINSTLGDLKKDINRSKLLDINKIKIRLNINKNNQKKIEYIKNNINGFSIDLITNSFEKNNNEKKLMQFIDSLENIKNLLWVEEPLPLDDLLKFKILKNKFKSIKFSYGENFNTYLDFLSLLELHRFDYVNPDISHLTISELIKLGKYIENKNLKEKIILHCWGGSINMNVSLHIASIFHKAIKMVEFPIAQFSLNEEYISDCEIKNSHVKINPDNIGNPSYLIENYSGDKVKKKSAFKFE